MGPETTHMISQFTFLTSARQGYATRDLVKPIRQSSTHHLSRQWLPSIHVGTSFRTPIIYHYFRSSYPKNYKACFILASCEALKTNHLPITWDLFWIAHDAVEVLEAKTSTILKTKICKWPFSNFYFCLRVSTFLWYRRTDASFTDLICEIRISMDTNACWSPNLGLFKHINSSMNCLAHNFSIRGGKARMICTTVCNEFQLT